MKIVGKYNNSFSANIAQGILQDAGIDSFILGENLNMVTMLNTDLVAVELAVDDTDYQMATELLAAKPE